MALHDQAQALQPPAALTSLWRDAGLPSDALSTIQLSGSEPALPSSFACGTAAQVSIAAAALAAAELWYSRCGRRQQVAVDMRNAAVEFRSERYLRVDGHPPPEYRDQVMGLYRCGDGRWVHLHTNFPHHRDGLMSLLRCAHERAAVQHAVASWDAEALETAAALAGLVVTAARGFAEWDRHPQGIALSQVPAVSIEKIGDAPPRGLPANPTRPLGGVRVLDLTRVIAGPVCGRTLAAYGAGVLRVTAPHLADIEALVIDSGRGKLSAHLDLRDPAQRAVLAGLIREADIFVQSYRPGALERIGFGPQAAAAMRPGIIYVSLSAYGHEGPWANRRGFDSLVQTASGFNLAEAAAARSDAPKPLPAQMLDHASGYLMAFGAMTALRRRTIEGGSWLVRVALAATGRWLRGLGRIANGFDCPDPNFAELRERLEIAPSGFGVLTSVRHAAQLSETPPRWERPSVPLGTHPAAWPD